MNSNFQPTTTSSISSSKLLSVTENSKVSITPFLCSATKTTIPDVLQQYENALRKSCTLENMLHANKLAEYRNIITDKKFISVIRKVFDQIYRNIIRTYPDYKFYMEGRRKSVLSTEKKILLYLSKNKPLDDLRDLLAFRIILFGDNSLDLIQSCYQLMENIIDFMISQGFSPCEATRVFETEGFSNEKLHLLIPTKSYLKEDYINFVKDYIIHPKKNGYQSIHVVFKDSVGRCFEVQIRTFTMHLLAESSSHAGHEFYKYTRYKENVIELDREKILIDGYGYDVREKKIYDFIGLENSLTILQREKTI